jgi:adenosylhomocysteinase
MRMSMSSGMLKIDWAAQYMPVLAAIKKQFEKEKPFAGMTIGMALHVEAKTANLVSARGGAECTSPDVIRSAQDDVAEALNSVECPLLCKTCLFCRGILCSN